MLHSSFSIAKMLVKEGNHSNSNRLAMMVSWSQILGGDGGDGGKKWKYRATPGRHVEEDFVGDFVEEYGFTKAWAMRHELKGATRFDPEKHFDRKIYANDSHSSM